MVTRIAKQNNVLERQDEEIDPTIELDSFVWRQFCSNTKDTAREALW